MKKSFILSVITILMTIFLHPFYIHAESGENSYFVQLHKQSVSDPERDIKTDREGYRAPARPLLCSIDKTDGVTIPTLSNDEIISYDIYREGICIASFSDEIDFTTFIFSYNDDVEIHINTLEWIFMGYLTL